MTHTTPNYDTHNRLSITCTKIIHSADQAQCSLTPPKRSEHLNFSMYLLTPMVQHSLTGTQAVSEQQNLFGLHSGQCDELLPVQNILAYK